MSFKHSSRNKATCILGMHRSGTSALMGALNILGVNLGTNLMNPSEDNPKGYFENNNIYQLNENILKCLNSSWDDLFQLPDKWWEKEELRVYKEEAIGIIKKELSHEEIFGIKDPRLCILFPFWQDIFKELNIKPYYIILVRDPLEVAESLKKRDGFSPEKSIILWMRHMLDAEFYSRDFPRVFISFDELLKDPERIIKKISSSLNIKFPKGYRDVKSDIKQFLEPGLKHYTLIPDNLNRDLLEIIFDYYHLLLNLIREEKISANRLFKIDDIRERFFKIYRFFYHKDIITTFRQGETRIENLEVALRERDTTLNSIFNSHGWKALQVYYRLRDKIFPPDTKRRLFAKSILYFITKPKGFLTDLNRTNFRKFIYYLRTSRPVDIEKRIIRKIGDATETVEKEESRFYQESLPQHMLKSEESYINLLFKIR